ncbi:MAG TPA: hypothetical protein VL382_12080 [Terriglobales bacterium]|jgi:hypothetical protein|nr:hypothetical protein [Terriglobales bacterium]
MAALITVLIRILQVVFVVGMAGSVLVIILSGVEDVETMFDSSDEPPSAH